MSDYRSGSAKYNISHYYVVVRGGRYNVHYWAYLGRVSAHFSRNRSHVFSFWVCEHIAPTRKMPGPRIRGWLTSLLIANVRTIRQ